LLNVNTKGGPTGVAERKVGGVKQQKEEEEEEIRFG
jgi:hypothetical protein